MFRLLYNGWHVWKVGSKSNNSGKAGVFYGNSNNNSTNDNPNIGSHLCLFTKQLYNNLATRQNTKQCLTQFGNSYEELEVK